MPIYLDRHNMQDKITAIDVARMHQEDLKIEHKFNCRGLTYWCDEKRRIAFCLIEAPNKKALQDMHNYSHGSVPHSILEVESDIVESFLGRVVDPQELQNSCLNIIKEPAFRIIMVVEIQRLLLNNLPNTRLSKEIKGLKESLIKKVKTFKANIVKKKNAYFLVSFNSVVSAVLCAIEFKALFNALQNVELRLSIGLSAGIPITDKTGLFEDAVKTANRLCSVSKNQIAITSEVKDLFEDENSDVLLGENSIYILSSPNEIFIAKLMDYLDEVWQNPSIKICDIEKELGYSKSTLYRKMIALTGKSINIFMLEYRLEKALKLLDSTQVNISEITYNTGFNTPAYFSKKFKEAYGLLPSNYIKNGGR